MEYRVDFCGCREVHFVGHLTIAFEYVKRTIIVRRKLLVIASANTDLAVRSDAYQDLVAHPKFNIVVCTVILRLHSRL